jgi:S1-C subfamily serine protease
MKLNNNYMTVAFFLYLVILQACGGTGNGTNLPGATTKIYIRFETNPSGANIYSGESRTDMRYIGTTPHTIQYAGYNPYWKEAEYQFRMAGYYDSQILHFNVSPANENRHVVATLVKMPEKEYGKAVQSAPTEGNKAQKDEPKGKQIIEKSRSGTGFFINSKGYLVSNDHVVKDCKRIDVVNPAVRSSARVLFTDAKNDIAVLKVDGYQTQYGAFRSGKAARAGDDITTVGFPLLDVLGSDIKVTKGNISSMTGLNNDSSMLQFSAPIQPGNSGGPLLDNGGNVVGVVSSKLSDIATLNATGSLPQNVNFAIKNQVVQLFLESHGIEFTNRSTDKNLGTAEVVDQARKYTLNVQCYE